AGGRGQARPKDGDGEVSALDGPELDSALDERGWAVVPGLVAPADCGALVAGWAEPAAWRKRVVMQQHGFGRGEYRYFAYPLPPLVQALRSALYARLAPVANRWAEQLRQPAEFPDSLDA